MSFLPLFSLLASCLLLPDVNLAVASIAAEPWQCPRVHDDTTVNPAVVECSCDYPHTLRCTGDHNALHVIGAALRALPQSSVSLLDCTLQDVTSLGTPSSRSRADSYGQGVLQGVTLHGLVISSGEILDVHEDAFRGLVGPLQALGLPNNQLTRIPADAFQPLSTLQRLDLSHNSLQVLVETDFQNIQNVTYLELSDNLISSIAPGTFMPLRTLGVLNLRGNMLTGPALGPLRELVALVELDLGDNRLAGPLNGSLLPPLQSLHTLHLNRNTFTSVREGALKGFPSLRILTLRHNQIDVVEDRAFHHLVSLRDLDLGHNGIVAVSNLSLFGLGSLRSLDLTHNFLRALTSDLVAPLRSLQQLYLNDNDISIVTGDALESVHLQRFTIADNPLSCDCSLTGFSHWLAGSSHLSPDDRRSPVCATPPGLEGGVLIQVAPEELRCDVLDIRDEPTEGRQATGVVRSYPNVPGLPVSNDQISLLQFTYNEPLGVVLTWSIDFNTIPYSCDAAFVYEDTQDHELLLDSSPLHCDSNSLADPSVLKITVPGSRDLLEHHRYRYCLVLIKGTMTDDVELVLGCSGIIQLKQSQQINHSVLKTSHYNIVKVIANLTENGELIIDVLLNPGTTQDDCFTNIAVFAQGSVIAKRGLHCGAFLRLQGFLNGPYTICAALSDRLIPGPYAKCTPAVLRVAKKSSPKSIPTTVGFSSHMGFTSLGPGVALAILAAAFALGWAAKRLRGACVQQHQCFVSTSNCNPIPVHPRYVKLQATTTL